MKIEVVVHPNARRPRIERDLLEVLHAYVSEPPLDGRANKAVIEALSDHFRVKKSEVTLILGHKSKVKIFEIRSEYQDHSERG